MKTDSVLSSCAFEPMHNARNTVGQAFAACQLHGTLTPEACPQYAVGNDHPSAGGSVTSHPNSSEGVLVSGVIFLSLAPSHGEDRPAGLKREVSALSLHGPEEGETT